MNPDILLRFSVFHKKYLQIVIEPLLRHKLLEFQHVIDLHILKAKLSKILERDYFKQLNDDQEQMAVTNRNKETCNFVAPNLSTTFPLP